MASFTKRKKHSKLVFIVSLISIFLLVVFLFIEPTRVFLWTIFRPLFGLHATYQDGKEVVSTISMSRLQLLNELEALKFENDTLVADNARLTNELEAYSEKKAYDPLSLVRAHVISKPTQSQYDTLIVSKPKDMTPRIGDPVYAFIGAQIGVVEQVSLLYVQVTLFSNGKSKTVGRLERSGYDVTLLGRGGGNMLVEVPIEIETALGDRILFPEEDNVLIGYIRDITVDDRDPNKKLYVTLPINILSLDHVYLKK